jgi:hypothetical protein
MRNTLTIAFLSGALCAAAAPAFTLDLPDYGSKNFSPSGDTPTYFINESAPTAVRTADTNANDWSAADAAAPVSSEAVASAPSRRHGSRHGQHVSSPRSGKHNLGKRRGVNHLPHSVNSSSGRTATAAPARSSSKKPVWVASARTPAKSGPTSAAKTTTAKPGKPGARHARAAVSYPVTPPGTTPLPEA